MFSCATVFDFVDESHLEGCAIYLGFCLALKMGSFAAKLSALVEIDLRREDAMTRGRN